MAASLAGILFVPARWSSRPAVLRKQEHKALHWLLKPTYRHALTNPRLTSHAGKPRPDVDADPVAASFLATLPQGSAMALVTCPDCEAQISDAAPACINCGKPMSVSDQPTATAAIFATSPQEKIFFDRNGVKVTSARFIVGTRTYAMQGVTSVKQAAKHPSRVLPIAFGIIGILLALDDKALIGTCLLVFAVLAWLLQKADWIVVLSSASGEQQALTSKDRAYIDAVISALNESLVYRG